MRIDQITIENCRCFGSLRTDFHRLQVQQYMPHHPQIAQREQRLQLSRVLD